MIQRDFYMEREDGVVLVRTYSDANMMIQQNGTGILYAEAIDPEELGRAYTETNIPIETDETTAAEAEKIVNILLGENDDQY